MLYVRFKDAMSDRLGPRLMEWEHSCFLMIFGLLLMQPVTSMWTIPNEDAWGAVIFALGLVRIASLIVNGIRRRETSWARAISAIVSSAVFMLIGVGYFTSGGSFAAAALFPIVALFELANYARAMRDVGSATA